MSFGGFVENNSGGGGGVRNIGGEISYNNERMPFGSFSQPRLVTTPTLAKSMFNSSGLSLALVRDLGLVFVCTFVRFFFCLAFLLFVC